MNLIAMNLPLSIGKLTKNYQSNCLSPKETVSKCLEYAGQLKELNAFIRLTSENAQQESIESTNRYFTKNNLGKLDGVPIAIKDNFCIKNIQTTCASRMLRDFISPYNATVYDRLKNHGAILIGKTNLDEFSMGSGAIDSHFGATKNIWNYTSKQNDNWHIAGGSSGGSAVCVASGICYAALGSDTGGSTRNPASYCGIVGLKPTYGLVSRHGLIPLVNSMDVPGILTRNIDDCLTMLNAIAGPDPFDSTTIKSPFKQIPQLPVADKLSVRNIKVGIPKEYHCDGISSEVIETWMKVADELENAGAIVRSISLPNTASSIFVYSILNQCEVASNMARYDGIEYGHRSEEEFSTEQLYAKTREEGFNGVVKNRILSGNYYLLRRNYEKYFEQALKVRRLIANDFSNAFSSTNKNDNVDVILTPTTLTDAPMYSDFIRNSNRDQCAVQDFCTQPANMAGIPAVSLPIRLSSNNLPLSVQLMGPNLSEELLLYVAKWIECNFGFQTYAELNGYN